MPNPLIAAALLAALAAPRFGGGERPGRRPAAAAPGPTAVELTRKVQAFYEKTRDLEAAFTQTYVYGGLGRKLTSTGTLKIKKPGLMRWDYQSPSPKVVAVTGKRLVQYEPEEQQACVDEQFDATALTAAVAFLLGKGDLARDFTPSLGEGGALVLRPKQRRSARGPHHLHRRGRRRGAGHLGARRGRQREPARLQRHQAQRRPARRRLRGEAAGRDAEGGEVGPSHVGPVRE